MRVVGETNRAVDAKSADFSRFADFLQSHLPSPSSTQALPHHLHSIPVISTTMAPNRVAVSKGAAPSKSVFSTLYAEARSPENTTIVRSLLVFGVCAIRSLLLP